jgi:uncharacterized membrane protein YcaP (DUF421 family)
MFIPSNDIFELVLRAAVIYGAIFLLLRLLGKRHVGELAPFDLVVLLLLSESVSSALNASETSITGGLLSAMTLFGMNHLAGYASSRSRRLERLLEGKPRILVRNGTVYNKMLAREQITRSELLEACRRAGCTSLCRVRYAILENDGSISVGLRKQS